MLLEAIKSGSECGESSDLRISFETSNGLDLDLDCIKAITQPLIEIIDERGMEKTAQLLHVHGGNLGRLALGYHGDGTSWKELQYAVSARHLEIEDMVMYGQNLWITIRSLMPIQQAQEPMVQAPQGIENALCLAAAQPSRAKASKHSSRRCAPVAPCNTNLQPTSQRPPGKILSAEYNSAHPPMAQPRANKISERQAAGTQLLNAKLAENARQAGRVHVDCEELMRRLKQRAAYRDAVLTERPRNADSVNLSVSRESGKISDEQPTRENAKSTVHIKISDDNEVGGMSGSRILKPIEKSCPQPVIRTAPTEASVSTEAPVTFQLPADVKVKPVKRRPTKLVGRSKSDSVALLRAQGVVPFTTVRTRIELRSKGPIVAERESIRLMMSEGSLDSSKYLASVSEGERDPFFNSLDRNMSDITKLNISGYASAAAKSPAVIGNVVRSVPATSITGQSKNLSTKHTNSTTKNKYLRGIKSCTRWAPLFLAKFIGWSTPGKSASRSSTDFPAGRVTSSLSMYSNASTVSSAGTLPTMMRNIGLCEASQPVISKSPAFAAMRTFDGKSASNNSKSPISKNNGSLSKPTKSVHSVSATLTAMVNCNRKTMSSTGKPPIKSKKTDPPTPAKLTNRQYPGSSIGQARVGAPYRDSHRTTPYNIDEKTPIVAQQSPLPSLAKSIPTRYPPFITTRRPAATTGTKPPQFTYKNTSGKVLGSKVGQMCSPKKQDAANNLDTIQGSFKSTMPLPTTPREHDSVPMVSTGASAATTSTGKSCLRSATTPTATALRTPSSKSAARTTATALQAPTTHSASRIPAPKKQETIRKMQTASAPHGKIPMQGQGALPISDDRQLPLSGAPNESVQSISSLSKSKGLGISDSNQPPLSSKQKKSALPRPSLGKGKGTFSISDDYQLPLLSTQIESALPRQCLGKGQGSLQYSSIHSPVRAKRNASAIPRRQPGSSQGASFFPAMASAGTNISQTSQSKHLYRMPAKNY